MRISFRGSGRYAASKRAVVALAALVLAGFPVGTPTPAHADDGASLAGRGFPMTWGGNSDGQLGDGSTAGISTRPVQVCDGPECPPLDDVIAVDGGNSHSIALRADGTVWTWGANTAGQLGDGTNIARGTPVRVCAVGATAPCTSFLTGVKAISAGASYNLALRLDGTVVAWGFNGVGQLGDGTSTNSRTVPVEVCAVGAMAPCGSNVLTLVTGISAGVDHSLVVRSTGNAFAFGNNAAGKLGDGTTANRSTPVLVCAVGATAPCTMTPLPNVKAVSAGSTHSVAVQTTGAALAWGSNTVGQLGDGTTGMERSTPASVCAVGASAPCGSFLTNVRSVAAGAAATTVVRNDGTAVSWGSNTAGKLGDGTTTDRNTPVQVCAKGATAPCSSFLTGVTAVATGLFHALALKSDATVQAWGSNATGQLGDLTTASSPVPVEVFGSLVGPTSVAAGTGHSLAVAVPRADLLVAMSAAAPGPGQISFFVSVDNFGPDVAEDTVLTFHIPSGASFVSVTPPRGHCDKPPTGTTNTVTCYLGRLGTGDLPVTPITLSVSTVPTTVEASATVTSTTPDPRIVNNSVAVKAAVS